MKVWFDRGRQAWSAFFTFRYKFYYADLVTASDTGTPEIMIFETDENYKVKDWEKEVYIAYPDSISRKNLLVYITKFEEELALRGNKI